MNTEYNIYCDESCHLEHDHIPIMLLGAIWCPADRTKSISKKIRAIKAEYNAKGELKWTKVSNCRIQFYNALIDYFFAEKSLNFRSLVVFGKDRLDHDYFNQGSHDSFYYKMYYQLLLNLVSQEESSFNIYLDIKDTRGSKRVKVLSEILRTKLRDNDLKIIKDVQLVRSHESQLIQLADFLIGAVGYENRNEIDKNNSAKLNIIERIRRASGNDIKHTTSPWEQKFNLFIFHPRSQSNE